MDINKSFETVFTIMSNDNFLEMKGLNNEVPFFVYAYDIRRQADIYRNIFQLKKRLRIEKGIETVLIGLYDMVIDFFNRDNELEDVFGLERELPKKEFLEEFQSMINQDDVVIPYFKEIMKEDEYKIVMVYQVGEVYPYLRTHTILNQLQSTVTDVPLVVFFPGEYVMSKEIGFNLNLFGRFPGPYYRAFRLDDYLKRGVVQ